MISGGVYPPAKKGTESILWAFGHGLSYGATFHYSDMKLSKQSISTDGHLEVTFTVSNNGTSSAEEVAQLYIRDDISSVTTPVMQLRGFERLSVLAPGTSADVTMRLDAQKDLWLVDLSYSKVVEPGNFTIMVGGSSAEIQLQTTFEVKDA
eukprot:COSAG02_NODE_4541_length_5234_cov_4.080818_8_plen_151_part_00